MPLSIGKVTINVDLCGSIPRSHMSSTTTTTSSLYQSPPPVSPTDTHDASGDRGAQVLRQKLVELTSNDLNSLHRNTKQLSSLVAGSHNGCVVPTHPSKKGETVLSAKQDDTIAVNNAITTTTTMRATAVPQVEPPQWAAPAQGQARLEPVCEALGTHPVIDLTTRSHFRIGRSPTSDVQLWHETSSRRHALLFHHPNGSCYIVDCGSAHGTYVNGKRVRSTPLFGDNNKQGNKNNMIVPHRVKRGALIRFGGPGAPAFVLKSFSNGMSSKVVNLITADTECDQDQTASSTVQLNTRLNALGSSSSATSILRKRSHVVTVVEEDDSSVESISNKRRRLCSSPPPESTQEERVPLSRLRLVSPDNIIKPSITERLPELASVMKVEPSSRRVTFSNDQQEFYPALVTPDELTDDDKSI